MSFEQVDGSALRVVIQGIVTAVDICERHHGCHGRFALVVGLRDRQTGAELSGFAPEGDGELMPDAEAEHLVRIVGQAFVNRASKKTVTTIHAFDLPRPEGGADQ